MCNLFLFKLIQLHRSVLNFLFSASAVIFTACVLKRHIEIFSFVDMISQVAKPGRPRGPRPTTLLREGQRGLFCAHIASIKPLNECISNFMTLKLREPKFIFCCNIFVSYHSYLYYSSCWGIPSLRKTISPPIKYFSVNHSHTSIMTIQWHCKRFCRPRRFKKLLPPNEQKFFEHLSASNAAIYSALQNVRQLKARRLANYSNDLDACVLTDLVS